jgi:hypothetical protein
MIERVLNLVKMVEGVANTWKRRLCCRKALVVIVMVRMLLSLAWCQWELHSSHHHNTGIVIVGKTGGRSTGNIAVTVTGSSSIGHGCIDFMVVVVGIPTLVIANGRCDGGVKIGLVASISIVAAAAFPTITLIIDTTSAMLIVDSNTTVVVVVITIPSSFPSSSTFFLYVSIGLTTLAWHWRIGIHSQYFL